MTEEIKQEPMDLASFIDAEQMPERMAAINGSQQVQPLSNEDGPKLLSEHPDRIANRRGQEHLKKVAVGELFHGWIKEWELKKADNGSVYIRFSCELEANHWRMTHTRFLPKGSLGTTESIAEARDKILSGFGYDFDKKQFNGVRLFEIGSYPGSDGKDHYKIGRIYADTKDYNSYQQWKWEKDHQPKKPWTVASAPLPE